MFNFYYITKEDIKERNLNWPQISDCPYRIVEGGGFEYRKTNGLFNLINHQPDIDKL